MSDAKPYTLVEFDNDHWITTSLARKRCRATVEALESARAERDAAQGIARESMCRFDELYAVLQEVKSMRALAEKERDEARDDFQRVDDERINEVGMRARAEAAHDLMAAEKERAEHAHNELVLSLPAMRRDVAERQREACAKALDHYSCVCSSHARYVPLATDGGGE